MSKRKARAFERGQDLWFLLPESERTAVRNELRGEGFSVSKATVSRWANQWHQVAREVADLIPVPAATADKAPADLSDIPERAKKALPERLWQVAKGQGGRTSLRRRRKRNCLEDDRRKARGRHRNRSRAFLR